MSIHKKKTGIVKLAIVVGILFCFFLIFAELKQSVLFSSRDRINVIIYDAKPTFYSIGKQDNVHYKGEFDSEISIVIPGGYGNYSIKALGELARIEKKPQLIQKSFSSLSASMVDYYFYSPDPNKSSKEPSFFKLLQYKSNASILDRFFLSFFLLNKKPSDYSLLTFENTKRVGETIEDIYFKKYQGYFYQKTYRQENKNTQIVYSDETSAKIISHILEGEGIRVVDLSYEEKVPDTCQIITNQRGNNSQTVKYISSHFKCIIKLGETGGQDLIVKLGKEVQQAWE